ncbi:MAG TPA: MFS transporter [Gemmatimonadaceae bacterium]|nr:MFS transporter [Gemmatimonadaceae bacterium]
MDSPAAARSAVPVGVLSLAGGAAVANLYYCQPLLPQIGRDFALANGRVGLVSTAAQIGYAVGLLVFVPLGDVVERRRLIVSLLVAVSIALAGCALAPGFGWLAAASFAVGLTTVVPQVVIPFAAALTPAESRGRVVGRLMGALLIGILGARVVAGAVGQVAGWRAMFAIASALMLALAVALWRMLAPSPPVATMPFGALLRSLVTLARAEPVVRDASAIGALCFLAFSAFWTTLAFRLELPPLHYGSTVAGLFGLVGVVGASAAPLVGRFADRSSPRSTVGIGLAGLAISYVVFLLMGHTIAGLVVGVILVDAAMQVVGVSNQARIYRLAAAAHSRLNTVYMVSYFAGGSVGSALGVWAWGLWRWTGVCVVAIAAVATAAALYWRGRRTLPA